MSLQIRIGGQSYPDVISGSVHFSMDEIANSFDVRFSDKWLFSGNQALPFSEGDQCDLTIDGEKVLTGFVENISIRYSASEHSLTLQGRSSAGLLVDCTSQYKTGSWKDSVAHNIISDLIEPYGISFSYDSTVPIDIQSEKVRRFAIEQEETVFDAISRLCKSKGFFVISQPNGDILGTRASSSLSNTVLRNGLNIIDGQREGGFQERFSTYIVKSQNAGDNFWYGENATSNLFAQEQDEEINLYKPLVIISETQSAKEQLVTRAKWEKNVRSGRSKRLTYNLIGFHQEDGSLWKVNQQIYVIDPFFDVHGVFIASAVNFQYSGQGNFTTIELIRPQAYDIMLPTKTKAAW